MSLHVIVNGLKNLKPQDISDISGIITQAGVGGVKMACDKKKEFQPIKFFRRCSKNLVS